MGSVDSEQQICHNLLTCFRRQLHWLQALKQRHAVLFISHAILQLPCTVYVKQTPEASQL